MVPDAEYTAAVKEARMWRAQHAAPTESCFRQLLEIAPDFPGAVLTFRLKRMQSILEKIRRPGKTYTIGTMDDIGGCRMILEDMEQLERAVGVLSNELELKKSDKSIKNYVKTPRDDGYRSCHFITRYRGPKRKYRVEVQVRTQLQHLWATTVEAAHVVYGINFKLDQIQDPNSELERQVRSFFATVSGLFALEETTHDGRLGDSKKDELVERLHSIGRLDSIIRDLSSMVNDVYIARHDIESDGPGFYLMRFARETQFLDITSFEPDESDLAIEAYGTHEDSALVDDLFDPKFDNVVLAYAQDGKQLLHAYPNYTARVGEFLKHMEAYL